ncbi:DUF354 domain-containing protein [Candidatus Woesearchaeota archaeon]|nr:DUF354 domain-containing protein [Candidatus Woesearchaeota archaeon]
MRILIDINHPADVHQFKNFIWAMEEKGHKFKIVARKKEHTLELLKAYGFDFEQRQGYSGFKKIFGLYTINKKLYKLAKSFNPDLLIGGPGDCYVSQTAFLLGKQSLIFDDTEFSKVQNWLTFPFATKILTPSCFWLDLGEKQVKYNGYHEIAYLHPKYFHPNINVVKKAGVNPNQKFALIRLVSWEASHDIGGRGITNPVEMIRALEKYGKVYISSEKELPKNLKKYKLKIKPESIHHILYYATLLIGESSTMASECAVLGTPAIFISNSQRGYTQEQEDKYGLVHHFGSQEEAIEKAVEILKKPNIKKEWHNKRDKMLKDKIDVTKWMMDFVESFPI